MTSLIKLSRSFISIKGEGAEKFLQGQVSCDVKTLTDEQFSFGTINTPKGRMYGLFKIIRINKGFLLCVEPSTASMVIQQLSKYCVFFKCDINLEISYSAYGDIASYSSKDPQSELYPTKALNVSKTSHQICLKLPSSKKNALFEIWFFEHSAPENVDDQTSDETWSTFETLQGIPELYAATQEAFILQDLNLQKLDAVSFKKGCYTGQEIIARMKFLGKQKKMTYLLTSPDKITVPAKSYIYASDGSKCGTVVRSHWANEIGSATLAIIKDSYVEENSVAYLNPECTIRFTISALTYS